MVCSTEKCSVISGVLFKQRIFENTSFFSNLSSKLFNLDLPSTSVCVCIRFYLIMNKGNNEGNRWYLKISFFVRMSVIFQSQFNRTAGEFQKNDFRKSNLSHDEEEVCSMSIIKHIRIEHTTCTSTINISLKKYLIISEKYTYCISLMSLISLNFLISFL